MTRVSADEHDSGYSQFVVAKEHGKTVHAYLDGVEVDSCITADSEQGFVERCVLDDKGMIQIDPNDKERIWIERVTGKVVIVFKDPPCVSSG